MFGILLWIGYQLSGVVHTIFQKRISKIIHERWALWVHLFFLPLWIAWILLSYWYDSSSISNNIGLYAMLILFFGLMVSFNTYLWFNLLKDINTSSFFKYKTWLTLFFALVSDFLFFNTLPSYISVFAGVMLFVSWNLLNNVTQRDLRMKLFLKLFALSFWLVLSTTILKQIVLITTNDFLSIFVVQTITHLIVGLFGLKYLWEIRANKKLFRYGMIFNCIILGLVIVEFYAFRFLSVFMIIALSNVKFLLYLAFDWHEKDLEWNKGTLCGTIVGLCGIGLLVLSKV